MADLRSACLTAWGHVWLTTVGESPLAVPLTELTVPASVVGYFFEVLLARQLAARVPGVWQGNQSKEDKDLVCLTDSTKSVEVKSSGQLGDKVFGNRSHGQKAENESLVKKEKSGYYVTVNFVGQVLTLIRFGWIDASDWIPQGAPTGQMAALKPDVYEYKLVRLPGAYRRQGPVQLLTGVGAVANDELARSGVKTIGDFIDRHASLPTKFAKVANANREFLAECADPPVA